MASLSLGFNLSANAAGMAQGINAGVVELQKLGLAAKQTQSDVRLLTGLQLGTAFVGGIRALSAAIGQANQLLSGFVDESVSIGEEAQKANVIFEGSADAIQEFARSSTGIGLSTKAALQATASFGNLFTAIGLNNRQAADYSQTLTVLAADLASFNNTSVEDAVLALGSALRGESEPIRRYGVLLSDATLKQTAQANGFKVTSGALTPVVRAQAAYLAILQQTSKAQGDFERTSDSLANQQRILGAEWNNVRAVIGDALQPAYRAIVQALRDSLPAIRQAGQELAKFVAGADFSALTRGAVSAFTQFAAAGQLLINVLGPALQKPLVAIGLGLAFINRQAIATGVASLASAFAAAGTAAGGYSIALATATVATNVFKASLRALAAATVVGVIVVGLGLAAEAALQYGTSGTSAAEDVKQQIVDMSKAIQSVAPQFETAGNAAQQFGAKVQAAVKIPEISLGDIAQDSINSAQSAIAGLAKELGGTVNLPKELISDFIRIQNLAQRANGDLVNQNFLLGQLVEQSNRFADSIKRVAERRQEDTRAAKEAADANRKAAEDARKRTSDLAFEGLGGGEQSRLKLAEDLLAIDRERKAAEEAFAAARRANDQAGIAAARERLQLVGDAAATAREQDRQRQLQALGIDRSLLQPAKTIADQFKALRDANRRGLLDPSDLQNAIQNIAREGLEARREIAQELSRPSQQALQVSDIRSSQGIAQFFQTGREDPAIEQRREQLARLVEIRRELQNLRAVPIEIAGR
jgi:hypothetical protein